MGPPGLKAGPITRVCHVCGRQYGLSSFDIHVKQCKKLFLAQEELKPPSERRQLPKTPPGLDGSGGRSSPYDDGGGSEARPTREMVEAMNRAAQEAFEVHGMEKCENCGRTFAEGRLAIHQRSCRPGHAAKRVEDGAAPRNKKSDEVEPAAISPVKKPTRPPPSSSDSAPTDRPSTSGTRALSGSLASNRKKIGSQDAATPQQRGMQSSPLAPTHAELSIDALRHELETKPSSIAAIQAKLDRWEATTLATLEEIRQLKQLFAQLR